MIPPRDVGPTLKQTRVHRGAGSERRFDAGRAQALWRRGNPIRRRRRDVRPRPPDAAAGDDRAVVHGRQSPGRDPLRRHDGTGRRRPAHRRLSVGQRRRADPEGGQGAAARQRRRQPDEADPQAGRPPGAREGARCLRHQDAVHHHRRVPGRRGRDCGAAVRTGGADRGPGARAHYRDGGFDQRPR